ncbi:hypothetical protein [Seonamhaeicola maritimus]|uniref:Uncharacterized protein n=1 Tax=Seonamhaeicola maritimus TaxID=2591822 RepID=A0A5C7GE19_9FLAO|nr:hypothetical protein [Seonamhaeicola maritimus]TXG34732.1 hypothetical protein FUA22_17645 [Seonamhaeicola maritimus]
MYFYPMLKKVTLLICLIYATFLFAQAQDSLSIKNGIDNPSLLTTHHFGIFNSRLNTNFKLRPDNKKNLSLNYTSGNNFHPFVEGYFPKNPEIQEQFKNTIWYHRNFNFIDQETTPAEYMNIVIDAVIKEFRLTTNFPIAKQQELVINLRSYLITKGKHPFSIFTSDESIEWFHSNIAGGEDPFGRRYYGLNQVNFEYLDRNGNTLKLDNNDFFIGGIEFSHYYYPKLSINETRNIYVNFGSHLGINTSKFNSSLDFGISANAVKQIQLKNKYQLNVALGANVLHKNLIKFKDNAIDFGNNPYLGTFESNLEITKFTKAGNYHSFGINYQMQTPYNKKEEKDYYHLRGKWQEIKGGWHHGVRTLYNMLSTSSLVYTYGRKSYKLSLFIKQDFEVNNAPDFQTGINLKVPFLQ